MDDRIFLGVMVYLILAAAISGFLPSGFYTGTSFESESAEDFTEEYGTPSTDPLDQLNFFQKVLQFFFVTWTVADIPAFLGVIITLFNIFVVVVGGVWVYDKFRGIGS